jgi:HEPN domain-containing protein
MKVRKSMHEYETWLLYASYDLNTAKLALTIEPIAIPTALSLSQQCAEKALKAFLIYKKHNFMRTHKLELLIDQCIPFDSEFETLRLDATDLSPHVTLGRYPDSVFGIPDLTTAFIIYEKANRIYKLVLHKLNQ